MQLPINARTRTHTHHSHSRTHTHAQMLINNKYIGGAEEIQELEDDGALDNLLGIDFI